MAGLTLSGLASGMDTDTVISQLMALEAQSKTRLLGQQYRIEARKTALDQVATKLKSLMGAADDLRSVGMWANVQTVESTDPAKVAVAYKSGAAVGSTTVNVTQLARASQQFLDFAATAGPNELKLRYSDDPEASAITVTWDDGATLADIAAKINGATGSAAFASAVGTQLVLSGKQTGRNLSITSTEFTPDATRSRGALEAEYYLDGSATKLTSKSNTVTTGLPGIEMTFKATTPQPVTINVGVPGADQKQIKDKVNAFVTAYNSTIDFIRGKLNEEVVKNPSTQSDHAKGVLRGDAALNTVLSKLRQMMGENITGDPASPNPEAFNALADIGIAVPGAQTSGTATADRLAGKLVVDDAKLVAALTSEPTAVRRLFGGLGTISGFSQKIDELINPMVDATSGTFAERTKIADRELTRVKDAQAVMDARLKTKEARLRKQFAAMEAALNQTNSTTNWLSGQIAGLTKSQSSS